MADGCDFCRAMHSVISKHIADLTLAKRLEKEETLIIVQYVMHSNEFKSPCRCLVKDLDMFWNLMHVLRKIFDVLATLIDKLNEDCMVLQQMRQMVAESSNESLESDNSDDFDIDGYTLKDRSNIIRCCAHLLAENFYIYTTYQRHFLHIPVMFSEPSQKVKKHFHTGNISTPVLFMLDGLLETNVLQRIASCLSKPKLTITPEIVANLMFIVLSIKHSTYQTTSRRYVWPIRDLMLNYLCDLADNQGEMLRDSAVRQISEHLWSLSRDYITENNTMDMPGLNLSVKHLRSHFLAARLAGLHQICVIINHVQDYDSEDVTECLAEALSEKEIIQTVFGPNLHVELVKQSYALLNLMALRGVLTKDDLDCVWAASQMKHCNRQVLDLLTLVVKSMESDLVVHLYSLLKLLKPSEHNDQTLQLTFAVIKTIWAFWFVKNSRQRRQSDVNRVPQIIVTRAGSSTGSTCPKEAFECDGDKRKSQENSSSDSISHELLVHAGGGDLSEPSSTVHEINSIVSSCSSSAASEGTQMLIVAGNVPDDPTSGHVTCAPPNVTATKRFSGDSLNEAESSAPINKRPKVSEDGQKMTVTSSSADFPAVCTVPRIIGPVRSTEVKAALKINVDEQPCCSNNVPQPQLSGELVVDDGGPGGDGDANLHWCSSPIATDDEESSSLGSVEERDQSIQRLLKYVKQPHTSILTPRGLFLVESRQVAASAANFHGPAECQILSSNNLLENLVKNKVQLGIRARSFCGTDSDVSSDAATSSDRMGDFEEEEVAKRSTGSPGVCDEDEEIVLDTDFDDNILRTNQQHNVSSVSITRFNAAAAQRRSKLTPKGAACANLINWTRRNEAGGDELNAFDLMRVCETGQTLLWDLIQEDAYNEHMSVENEDICLQHIEELVAWQPYAMGQFVKACADNLKNHRSSVVAVKLLTRLFNAFIHFGTAQQANVMFWSDLDVDLILSVLEDLSYHRKHKTKSRYGENIELKVRFNFLDFVYSNQNSFRYFALSETHLDLLWDCLTNDDLGRESLYCWVLDQLKTPSQRAINSDTVNYILKTKTSRFNVDTLSSTGLALLHALLQENQSEADPIILPLLWQVALRNVDTNVGMAAMQFVSNYYVYGSKAKEKEFIDWCMEHLCAACRSVDTNFESSLTIIHRALNLLYSHIEAFRKRYAFFIRLWELEGSAVISHCKRLRQVAPEITPMIRVNLQVAGNSEKLGTLVTHCTTLLSELRAEICYWWQHNRRQGQITYNSNNSGSGKQNEKRNNNKDSRMVPDEDNIAAADNSLITYANLKGALKLLFSGRELSFDLDGNTLLDIGFKEVANVLICPVGYKVIGPANFQSVASLVNTDLTPMKLLGENHWQLLMNLVEKLNVCGRETCQETAFRCRTYCMRAWEVIQLLPTSVTYLDHFNEIFSLPDDTAEEVTREKWEQFFQTLKRHAFLYALQVLEFSLIPLKNKFIQLHGLDFIVNVLLSKSQFPKQNELWDQWSIEIVTSLLRIVYCSITTISTGPSTPKDSLPSFPPAFNFVPSPIGSPVSSNGNSVGGEGSKRSTANRRAFSNTAQIRLAINQRTTMASVIEPLLCSTILPSEVIAVLMEFIAQLSSDRLNCLFLSSFLRVHSVNCCFQLLNSLLFSSNDLQTVFLNLESLPNWLNGVLLECGDAFLRREIATGLYKLCRGKRPDGSQIIGKEFIMKLATDLFLALDAAQKISPLKQSDFDDTKENMMDGKEPYGASSSNYFWLISNLIDFLREEFSTTSDDLKLEETCVKIFDYLKSRPIYETHDDRLPDYGLVGLIQLAISVIKFDPVFKTSQAGMQAVNDVFDMIFCAPTKQCPLTPKCKSQAGKTAAYDLLVELSRGYEPSFLELHKLLMRQNSNECHAFYPWDYWPADERRAACGFSGVMNLGATCYMASAVQQLFMIPAFRNAILNSSCPGKEHEPALKELQRMFTFLLLSERKAYNPRSFCKAYIMNHQPLNVTEQKDMNEFFTDLITKLDEMTPELRKLVKNLFGGIMSNNVVSLDCCHVSKTTEIFYSVRCTVADMKNLYDSLNSMTVADMLEGDNMYTCSQCNKKVRAEKRACFKQLPKVLCFNTLRYTFNMITMTKEKVNTHFSFPMRLNMSAYMEENLLPKHASEDMNAVMDSNSAYEYELVGVTVHTGTADGGHYYSFIKDRNSENWYCFNDAEVRPWDPASLDSECFGGELTKQQYDTVSDKFTDLPYEKTNSAYMLFYERVSPNFSPGLFNKQRPAEVGMVQHAHPNKDVKLPADLEDWIYEDNRQFIQDLMFFDHAYSNFVWQICSQVRSFLLNSNPNDLTLLTSTLSLSYLLETLIHSKEKPTLTNWTELVIKDLSSCPRACEWFLTHVAKHSNWLVEILISNPQKASREMLQKLCMHAIMQLQIRHEPLYLLPWQQGQSFDSVDAAVIGRSSCVTSFIRQLLQLLTQGGASLDSRQLNEYFALIFEFGRSSKVALKFLLLCSVITTIITFYLTKSSHEAMEMGSEDESDEDNGLLLLVRSACGLRSLIWPAAVLEKIAKILMLLFEAVRDDNINYKIRSSDWALLIGPKGFQFLMQFVKDSSSANLCGVLILSLCNLSPPLTPKIIDAIFERLQSCKDDVAETYFGVVNFIMQQHTPNNNEANNNSNGITPTGPALAVVDEFDVVKYIIEKVWQLAASRPLSALKWFEHNVAKHKEVYTSLKCRLEYWTNAFLFNAVHCAIRQSAAEVLIACIQSSSVRQTFHQICQKSLVLSPRSPISSEATKNLHDIYGFLLSRMPVAYGFADTETNSTHRLVSYFNVLKACLVSRDEKLMVIPYFEDLWRMYKAHMCEKQVKIYANKQAVLTFWYMASLDCPELVQAAVSNQELLQQFMYTYIFTHNDDEQIEHNRKMLHAFYGLMKLFCNHSPAFAESVMVHENFDFACRSVSIADNLAAARDEIFSTIEICFRKIQSQKEKLRKFREKICGIYLNLVASSKSHYFTFLRFLRVVESDDDKLYLIQNQILTILTDNFFGVHEMHHNATGCCCLTELSEMLKRFLDFLKFVAHLKESEDQLNEILATNTINNWGNMHTACMKLLELLNSYNPPDVRRLSMECIKKIVCFGDSECLKKVLVVIGQSHNAVKCTLGSGGSDRAGPYFPRRSHSVSSMSQQHLRKVHPPHPMLNMCLHSMQVEAAKGVDVSYDQCLAEFFSPYHTFVDRLLRSACNLGSDIIQSPLIAEVSCLLGLESVPLHFAFFAKFWLDLWHKFKEGKDVKDRLDALRNCKNFREYLDALLTQEQMSLDVSHIYNFVQEVALHIAPECITLHTRRQALENAASLLCDPRNVFFSETEFERLSYLLMKRIGALRIVYIFCDNAQIARSIRNQNFYPRMQQWLAKVSECVEEIAQKTAAAVDADAEDSAEYLQQVRRYVQMLEETCSELKQKICQMVPLEKAEDVEE